MNCFGIVGFVLIGTMVSPSVLNVGEVQLPSLEEKIHFAGKDKV